MERAGGASPVTRASSANHKRSCTISESIHGFRILIASDIHLGFEHRSRERRLDSLNTFEELLQVAVNRKVHFVLLAGNLFHMSGPPNWVIKESMRLLRKYCFGYRQIDFKLTFDPSRCFADLDVPVVNYEDPNFNVSLPVFAIHGSHDGPVGVDHESVVKLLSAAGLVNYFGHVKNAKSIELEPLLFERDFTKVAIYSLGSMSGERLSALFRGGRVHFRWPKDSKRWFKILLLHQNRVKRGRGGHLPESLLPNELNLVVWGNQHECLIKQQYNGRFYVTQPGSTVATSLRSGEMLSKHVGILRVEGKTANDKTLFCIEPVQLSTVRQLFVEDVTLPAMSRHSGHLLDQSVRFLVDQIERIVEKAAGARSGHPKQPVKPLIRLRVLYGPDHETSLPHTVGRHFKDKIANPVDCLEFVGDKVLWPKQNGETFSDTAILKDIKEEQTKAHSQIDDLLNQHLKNALDAKSRLYVLHEDTFTRAVQLSTEVGCRPKDIIRILIDSSRSYSHEHLTCTEEAADEACMMARLTKRSLSSRNSMDGCVQTIIKELEKRSNYIKAESHIEDVDDSGVLPPPPCVTYRRPLTRSFARKRRRAGTTRRLGIIELDDEPDYIIIEDSDEDGLFIPAKKIRLGAQRSEKIRCDRVVSQTANVVQVEDKVSVAKSGKNDDNNDGDFYSCGHNATTDSEEYQTARSAGSGELDQFSRLASPAHAHRYQTPSVVLPLEFSPFLR